MAEAGGNSVRVWVHVEGDSRWVVDVDVDVNCGDVCCLAMFEETIALQYCLPDHYMWRGIAGGL